ncbi:MAG: hypothetical protein AB8B65_09595 [Kordia sp.]|uniref:hypothetical protein n=1 Tax=Kordia sp. TaxID=1965332 RepID=UPI00385970DA
MNFKKYTYIFVFMCFGCTNTVKEKVQKATVSNTSKSTNLSFVDSVQTIRTEKPFQIPQYHSNGRLLTQNEFQQLQLATVFGEYIAKHEYRLLGNLALSNNYKTLLFGASDNVNFGSTFIVTYSKNYNLVSHKLANHHGKKGPSTLRTFFANNSLFVENTELNTSAEFIFDQNGTITPSDKPVTFKGYRYLDKFQGYLHQMPKRTVKAKSGLIIRDKKGNPIGKTVFGETVYIVNYTKDSITIKDEGKTIKAPKARIVLDPTKVTQGKDFYIEPSNIGYVFSGFLFDYYGNHTNENSLYGYDYLRLGNTKLEENATINLRDLFDIKRVDFKKYQDKISKSPKSSAIDIIYRKGKVLTLPFDNGEKLVLKDTTYNSEYNPTRSYSMSFHESFPNSYLVSETMFFTEEKYTVLSKKTGDTIQKFIGYPHISPSKEYSVAVFPEFECMQQTFIIVTKLVDGKYENYASIQTNSWSYPYKFDANDIMKDVFSIYWVSETEFILYAKNPEECYMENPTDYFYLKYKIKH